MRIKRYLPFRTSDRGVLEDSRCCNSIGAMRTAVTSQPVMFPVRRQSQHYSSGQDCLASVKLAQIAVARGSNLFNGTRQRNFRAEASRLLESAPGQIVS
jgi:hypothetical protein